MIAIWGLYRNSRNMLPIMDLGFEVYLELGLFRVQRQIDPKLTMKCKLKVCRDRWQVGKNRSPLLGP